MGTGLDGGSLAKLRNVQVSVALLLVNVIGVAILAIMLFDLRSAQGRTEIYLEAQYLSDRFETTLIEASEAVRLMRSAGFSVTEQNSGSSLEVLGSRSLPGGWSFLARPKVLWEVRFDNGKCSSSEVWFARGKF